jgi:hypothetical protein
MVSIRQRQRGAPRSGAGRSRHRGTGTEDGALEGPGLDRWNAGTEGTYLNRTFLTSWRQLVHFLYVMC